MCVCTGQAGFFVITIICIVLLNASNGIYQNSVYGLAADFPADYSNALVLGNNVCGMFISVVAVIALISACTRARTRFCPIAVAQNEQKIQAAFYFGMAILALVAALTGYLLLPRLNYFRLYHALGVKRREIEQHRLSFEHNAEQSQCRAFGEKLVQMMDVARLVRIP
jgi:equilibrative nucleoside transporter 1/2/3